MEGTEGLDDGAEEGKRGGPDALPVNRPLLSLWSGLGRLRDGVPALAAFRLELLSRADGCNRGADLVPR
jgi:hypothetical protein